MAQVYTKIGTETRFREELAIVEQDMGFEDITLCRPKMFFFEFEGLKPSTPHWIYLDKTDVTNFVNTTIVPSRGSYDNLDRNSIYKNPGDLFVDSTSFPTALGGPTAGAGQPLNTTSTGRLSGLLYVQSNSTISFPVGVKVVTAMDVSTLDKTKSLSYAQTEFHAHGLYELYTEVEKMQTVAYEEDIYGWVDRPPVKPSGNSGNSDDGDPFAGHVSVYNSHDNYNYYMSAERAAALIKRNTKVNATSGSASHSGRNDKANNASCVIATYANSIGSDLLNSREKKKAEIWCIRTYHDKWWGEAIRKGYRHLGNKAIAKGTAEKHFEEFINYVNFGSGKQRSVKSGLNFIYRTIQFLTLGLTVARREK